MPLIPYIEKNFTALSLAIIDQANDIITDYAAQGFSLTLRQLYYQFVARDRLPNTQRSYKRLGSIVSDARRAGLIDWDAIEDRTRFVRENSHWETPQELLAICAEQFALDKWDSQPCRPEVWIEKDALIGVIEGVCNEFDVPHFSCRGYVSDSAMWRAARRMRVWAAAGQQPIVLHLGDHDPSGVDMTRDIADRLAMFAGSTVDVRRLALNRDQIEQYAPPPNPAKLTDSRANNYVAEHGYDSWELDALEPKVIADLISEELFQLRDHGAWDEVEAAEARHRAKLADVAARWEEIIGE